MKSRLCLLTLLGLIATSGCAPFNGDVPETHSPPATVRGNNTPSPPMTTAPGETRRP